MVSAVLLVELFVVVLIYVHYSHGIENTRTKGFNSSLNAQPCLSLFLNCGTYGSVCENRGTFPGQKRHSHTLI